MRLESKVTACVIGCGALAFLAGCSSNDANDGVRDVPGLGAGFAANVATGGSAGAPFVPTAGIGTAASGSIAGATAGVAAAPAPVGGTGGSVAGTSGAVGGTGTGGTGGGGTGALGGTGAFGGSGVGGMTTGGTGGVGGVGGSGGAGMTGGSGGAAGMTTGGTGGGGNPDDPFDAARQACVDHINEYRAMLGLSPLMRATPEQEACSDMGAETDAAVYEATGQGHTSSGSCPGLGGQNTCPSWPVFGSVESTVLQCLDNMWDEGPPPGTVQQCIADRTGCFLMHGHYINMSNPDYGVVACGFYELPDGRLYMNQDFGY